MIPLVVVVHTEDGLRPEVPAEVFRQGYEPRTILTPRRDPFAYAGVLRQLWRWEVEFVLVEQDVVPPEGALDALFACPRPWCSHPHWGGTHYITTTTGLVRWSVDLRRRWPDLMDVVCAQPEPRYWVRRGWTRIPHDCSPQVLNGAGRRAALGPGAPPEVTSQDPAERPTTHDWRGIDSDLAYQLQPLGHDVHIHPEPTRHLHDYSVRPYYEVWTCWDEPYDPEFWAELDRITGR